MSDFRFTPYHGKPAPSFGGHTACPDKLTLETTHNDAVRLAGELLNRASFAMEMDEPVFVNVLGAAADSIRTAPKGTCGCGSPLCGAVEEDRQRTEDLNPPLTTIWGSVEEAEKDLEPVASAEDHARVIAAKPRNPFDNWPSGEVVTDAVAAPAYPEAKTEGRTFPTGSRRDSREGKGRCDLLPARALLRLAKHFERGAEKYGDRNWEQGQPLSVYADSAQRHLLYALMGYDDEDHLIAAAWNLMCLVDTQERIDDGLLPDMLDDLPKLPFSMKDYLPDATLPIKDDE